MCVTSTKMGLDEPAALFIQAGIQKQNRHFFEEKSHVQTHVS